MTGSVFKSLKNCIARDNANYELEEKEIHNNENSVLLAINIFQYLVLLNKSLVSIAKLFIYL